MSAQHTRGRIKVQHAHAGPRGFELADEKTGLNQVCQDAAKANARRLAACWNACEDVTTEMLESIPYGMWSLLHQSKGFVLALRSVRAYLLGAKDYMASATVGEDEQYAIDGIKEQLEIINLALEYDDAALLQIEASQQKH